MKLKVGDKIYFFKYGKDPICFETIIKKTPKFYKTKNYTFKIDGEYIRIRGKSPWDNTSAEKETEELNKRWIDMKKMNWFDNKEFTEEEKLKIYKYLITKN